MKNTPNFSDICKLMDGKPEVWEQIKPIVKAALLVAPGLLCGGFGTSATAIASLETGLFFSDIMDTVENAIFSTKQIFGEKKVDFKGEYEKARIANTLLVFSAYFDTVQQKHPCLWEAIDLDGAEAQWLTQKAIEDYGDAGELMGSDGRQILAYHSGRMENLMKFYNLLNDRMRTYITGLAGGDKIRADWDLFPKEAVCNYRKQVIVLCQKSTDFLVWTGAWVLEGMVESQEELSDRVQLLIEEIRNTNKRVTPTQLHLPPLALLRNRGFIGRKAELDMLEQAILDGDNPVLSGPGGIGKTELVAYFARKVYKKGQVYFVRFRNSFRETVTHGIAEGVPGLLNPQMDEQDIYITVMECLHLCKANDILIIDNVDHEGRTFVELTNESEYTELLNLPMRVIITTRFDVPRAIKVNPLSKTELYQIFRNHEVEITEPEMDDLINAVAAHTLTVDLIARTLKGGWKPVMPQELLDALANKRLSGEIYQEIGTDYNRSLEERKIYDHLRIVFSVAGIPEEARVVLRCATLLPPEGISSLLFGKALPKESQDTINLLSKHGWLGLEDQKILIHPVIRLVCWEELRPSSDNCKVFLDALWKQCDQNEYNAIEFRQLAELFSNASNDIEDAYGESAKRAGEFWRLLGMRRHALEYCTRWLNCLKKAFSAEHPSLATAYNNIGSIYCELGDYNKGLEYQLCALEIREKVIPDDNLAIANSYNNIGSTYQSLGDNYKALDYLRKAISLLETIHPKNLHALATTYNNVGLIYGTLGNHRKALEYHVKAKEILEKIYSNEHPSLATIYDSLGGAYGALGCIDDALGSHISALKIREKVLPENHPDLASSYNNVGSGYLDLGEYKKALEYKHKAITILEKVFTVDYHKLALTYDGVGCIYGMLGENNLAIEFMIKAMEILVKILPDGHPDIATNYNNMGGIYNEIDDYGKALEYQMKALEIRERIFSADHPSVALCYSNVGSTYYKMGDYDTALSYLSKALEMRERILPANHPDCADSLDDIGCVYIAVGEILKAREYINKAFEIRKKVLPENHPNLATSYINIGRTYAYLKEYSMALPYVQKAVKIAEQSLPEGHPDLKDYRDIEKRLKLFLTK